MAPKQPAALKNPPPADTSSEEEEESDEEVPETQTKTPQKPDSSSEEEETSSDEEEEDKENKKPSVDKSDSDSDEEDEEDEPEDKNKSSVNKSDSGSDEDDADAAGSDTESADTAPLKVEPKEVVKPKPVEVVIASPAVKSALSNQKKGKASGADEKKSPAFTRVFGDDDEVAVLNGMDEFRKKTGRDPNVDRDGFFEFMKKSLKIDVSKSQLMDKVRRLKKKYQNHEKKGKDPVITKPHELKLYELSKKVWSGDVGESAAKPVKRKAVKYAGSDDVRSEVAKSNKKAKVSVDLVVKENGATKGGLELGENVKSEAEEGWDAFPYFKEALEVESTGYYFKRSVDFNKIGPNKAKEMDDLCRAYHVKELELKSARVELQEKITKLLHDTLKS